MKIPLEYSLKKLGVPLIITLSKPHLCFLIDTGAKQNIIFSFVQEYISSSSSIIENSAKVMGIEGMAKEAMQVETNVTFDKKECSVILHYP